MLRGLFPKFLLVLVPVFLTLAVPGVSMLVHHQLRDEREALAARFGNQAARAAAALGRHDVSADPVLARDLLGPLAADRAFVCAELRADQGLIAAAPPGLGCRGQEDGQRLALPVGDAGAATLVIRFTTAELDQAERRERSLALSIVALGFVLAVAASALGFRLIVGRPLGHLLAATRRAAETGVRIPVAHVRRDELGSVIAAFNDMVASENQRERALAAANQALRTSQAEIAALNADLEARIRARTADLEAACHRAEGGEAHLGAILRTVVEAIVTSDERGTIQSFNPAAERLFGYTAAEAIGQNLRILMPAAVGRQHDRQLRRYLRTGRRRIIGVDRLTEGRRKDGSVFPLEIAISEMRHAGERQFIGALRDVTARLQAEATLRAAKDQAEAANEAKSRFLATMSHEIRTPLNGVLGMIELLRMTGLDDRQRHLVETIARSGRTLLSLVNDILDLAKIESGKIELDASDFAPRTVVDDVVAMFAETAAGCGLTLEREVAADVPPWVRGDGARLEQILINLVGNALKFTEQGGVHVTLSRLAADGARVVLRIEVRDSGIGIPEARQASIFEAFEQVDGSTTRCYGGTGLGLAITRRLVALMGGELGLTSQPGTGSTFWFTVAAQAVGSAPAEVEAPADDLADQSFPARVLVVEDNPVNGEITVAILESFGCAIELAQDGAEAVARFRPGAYDLVFMDCQMPRLDGYEATRRLREIERRSAAPPVPIIALTAGALAADAERCHAAGMDGHLAKPFTRQQIGAVMAAWFGTGDRVPAEDRHLGAAGPSQRVAPGGFTKA